jgi:predicted metal-dependent phosphoesterase TrpH
MKIDLHIQTNYSDGALSPQEIVKIAADHELDVISITDHDNILAYDIAKKYIKDTSSKLEIIRGVEINTIYKEWEVHILGYFMDVNNADFINLLKVQQQARINQTYEIIELLGKKEGIKIKFDDVKKLVAPGGSIGRPHIARAIVHAGGVGSVIDAYQKYINYESPVYVQRKTVSPHEAVEVIYEAGGIPVFAHPIDVDISDKLAKELVSYGLRGIEVYHRKHTPAVVEYYSTLAENLGLIITGGSDFHAPSVANGKILMGKNFVPSWVYDELIKEKRRVEMS